MESFEFSKNEITPDGKIEKSEESIEKKEKFAETFEGEMMLIEAQRLRKPEGSAYDNLKRFGKRAIAIGMLISSLAAATPALSQTYRPYIETGSLKTGAKIVSLESYAKKTPEIENKLREARFVVDQILSRIGETEQLSLAKLDVDIIANFDDSDITEEKPLDGGFSHENMLLQVRITKDFNIEKHSKALEAMLAHEIGHFINESADQDISKQETEAMHLARLENPEISKELTALESKKKKIEQTKKPELFEIKEKRQEMLRRLAVENLTDKEGRWVRDQIESFKLREAEIIGDFVETDPEYCNVKNRIQKLNEELEPKIIPHLVKRGGPEVIADFFQARWAAKQGWSAEELKEAMKILIGEFGPTSSELYGSTINRRHALVQFFFNRMIQEPEKYFNLPNNEQTIRNCIEKMYEEFLYRNPATNKQK